MAPAKQLMVYPANRLEDLAVLLNHVLKLGQTDVLTSAQVIVENTGMQHWLNTQLASQNGIVMNVDYPLPGKFIWQLARQLMGEDAVPQQPPYQREALVWRIDALLASDEVLASDDFAEANVYWQSGEEGKGYGDADLLKRFQLASALADLFEQYILYRPDWLNAWQATPASDGNWQAAIWYKLCQQDDRHPISIQQRLIESINKQGLKANAAATPLSPKLPQQICLFALNTMAPATLEVFAALAHYTQVHVFHLNPCAEYWGHIQSEKAIAAAHLKQWLAQADDAVVVDGGNPLLANLGSQGKEFFRLLESQSSYSIDAFDDADVEDNIDEESGVSSLTTLQHVQQDILRLHDQRQTPAAQIDNSMVFTSASSALRELQGLHDWLLEKFQQDPNLKPSDVIVMCPQVEDYAPYVSAVFDCHHGYQHVSSPQDDVATTPKVPCSIADRKPQDAEPIVAAFLQLLQLPDSRFQVSSVLDLLRLPAMQRKFAIAPSELETIEVWLTNACVHWGLDAQHKTQVLGLKSAKQEPDLGVETHTWAWGLKRLLLGFAQGAVQPLYQQQWLLADVDGGDAVLLGRLMQVLEQLQYHAQNLGRPRLGTQWHLDLTHMIDEFFSADSEDELAKESLASAIGNMALWVQQVEYSAPITLDVVRYSLTQKLSVASSSQAFITGQVTFCSMVPMRSIPFKLVAMLGLNDGQYPRQSTPIDFDLMTQNERRVGDRSRRGDDRYLFLEALISARQCLYLSYQGVDSKSNAPRQPSLMVTELMDYLQRGYGWAFDAEKEASQLRKLPLHCFSTENFFTHGDSYEHAWLRLMRSQPNVQPAQTTGEKLPCKSHISIKDLVQFLDNPGKRFAHETLGLFLQEYDDGVADDEPFASSKLVEYKLRDQLLSAHLTGDDMAVHSVVNEYTLNGELPSNHLAQQVIEAGQEQATDIVAQMHSHGFEQATHHKVTLVLGELVLEDQLSLIVAEEAVTLLLSRPSKPKIKDWLNLWVHGLVAQIHMASAVTGISVHQDKNLALTDTSGPEKAQELLNIIVGYYQEGMAQVLALDADVGKAIAKLGPVDEPAKGTDTGVKAAGAWNKAWHHHKYSHSYDFANDPYRRWLWPQPPKLEDWQEAVLSIYGPMVESIAEVKHA